tara:strand:- start:300 stop:677 length:378 start_codon:yes stop_codon:yes gene_type:complete
MIDKLSGVILWTEDLKKMSEFYTNVLNLKPNSVKSNYMVFSWVNGNETFKFSIGYHPKVSGKSNDSYRIMINFNVDNIYEEIEHLKKYNVQIIREPEKEKWGGIVASFLDPDRNIIQLLQHPEIR